MKTPRAGRPPKIDQRNAREGLLGAAISRFARYGFRKVGLSDIASDAGVSIGLIRHYFRSKDGLIEACNETVTRELGELFRQMLDGLQPDNGAAFIDELQQRSMATLKDKGHLLYYLRHLSIDQPAKGADVFREYFQLLQGELNRLEALGYLRKDVNKVWLTFHLMFMQLGPVYLSEQIEAIVGVPAHSERALLERGDENVRILKRGILSESND